MKAVAYHPNGSLWLQPDSIQQSNCLPVLAGRRLPNTLYRTDMLFMITAMMRSGCRGYPFL